MFAGSAVEEPQFYGGPTGNVNDQEAVRPRPPYNLLRFRVRADWRALVASGSEDCGHETKSGADRSTPCRTAAAMERNV